MWAIDYGCGWVAGSWRKGSIGFNYNFNSTCSQYDDLTLRPAIPLLQFNSHQLGKKLHYNINLPPPLLPSPPPFHLLVGLGFFEIRIPWQMIEWME